MNTLLTLIIWEEHSEQCFSKSSFTRCSTLECLYKFINRKQKKIIDIQTKNKHSVRKFDKQKKNIEITKEGQKIHRGAFLNLSFDGD